MMSTTQRSGRRPASRPGTIAALVALTMVALIGFLGLAIDIGMIAIAKTQTQQAADLAALTAARTLNGDSTNTYNKSQATTNAQNVIGYNKILGSTFQTSQLTLTYGSYDYNQTTQLFAANYPATAGQPYTAVSSSVTATNLQGAFGKIFGSSFLPNVTATAQAVHRPRDIALVIDLSGSMRFGTVLGFDFYTATRTSNNPDPTVPTFSHYSSANAGLIGPSTAQTSGDDSYTITPSNFTLANSSYALTYINSFYQNAAYASTMVRAFDSYTSTDGGITWSAPSGGATPVLPPSTYATTPGGDVPLFKNGSTTTYATSVNDVLNGTSRNTTWELDGYANYSSGSISNWSNGTSTSYPSSGSGSFVGYTKGPAYYGKTFFIWPPDPRAPLSTTSNTGWSTTAQDATAIKQFLLDFGYTAADFNCTSVATTLAGNVNSSTTSLTVNSSASFPSTPFLVVVGSSANNKAIVSPNEIMKVTAIAGTNWTVVRGQNGTSAAAASSGVNVGLLTGPPLYGIYTSTAAVSASQTWPWASGDTASGTTAGTLSYYLVNNVYQTGPSNQKLTTSIAAFQKIMRLYNWNYAVDNVGTTPCDWRIRFFNCDANNTLFASSGVLNLPQGNYTINYNEILRWLTTTTDPFPSQLRSGRIKYYGSIPTSITGSYPNYGSTDQRFWVEFIDYVLGFKQTSAGNYVDISAMSGYGADFTWGTIAINGNPAAGTVYMNYNDNPARPNLRYWFSPMMLVDFLNNYNTNVQYGQNYFFMQPANSYEAPLYTGKQAFVAAVATMKNNHPNDWVTIAPYSWPRTASSGVASGAGTNGRFNCVSCPLGTNYNYATASLLFPFSTIKADGTCNNTEVTPYDADPANGNIPSANFVDIPRADGDTCFAMGLMLAYNQFAVTATTDSTLRNFVTSTPITFPASGMAGGLGRKGAQKVIIFETDGLPNTTATASLVTASAGYTYYKIRYDMNNPTGAEYPSIGNYNINDPTVTTQINNLVTQLQTTYSTSRNPFRLYAIGFGPVFNSGAPDRAGALTTLQNMQYYAGTQSSASTALPSNQIITGTDATMLTNMTSAYTSILQSGVQIALIK
jgi:Flp pilus assembly protein TadG